MTKKITDKGKSKMVIDKGESKMVIDKVESKVDEPPPEVGSVLAHEFSSLSLTKDSNLAEASSSRSHPLQASTSGLPDVDQHGNHRPGFRVRRTDLGLVRVDLRNMVEKKQSGYITTLDVYKKDPWLLKHVHNDMFRRNEWFYFSPRSKRGGTTSNRTVPGTEQSEGGTWKSTTTKEPIKDKEGKVEGYKQNLVYYKKVNGKLEKYSCGWLMTEYCLHNGIHDDVVLCYIRGKIQKEVNNEQVPQVANNIISNQVKIEETGLTGGVNQSEMTMQQRDHGDATPTQQKVKQEHDTPILCPPPREGQESGFETTMTTQNNDNNSMTIG